MLVLGPLYCAQLPELGPCCAPAVHACVSRDCPAACSKHIGANKCEHSRSTVDCCDNMWAGATVTACYLPCTTWRLTIAAGSHSALLRGQGRHSTKGPHSLAQSTHPRQQLLLWLRASSWVPAAWEPHFVTAACGRHKQQHHSVVFSPPCKRVSTQLVGHSQSRLLSCLLSAARHGAVGTAAHAVHTLRTCN
jgi:hypothetical protein